jgi:hypothetical protein
MESTRELARQQGYVETLFGRRLYLPDIKARNVQRRQAAERTAINAPMQGTAADIIKKAMLSVREWINSQPIDVKMIMQVHDELVFELPMASLRSATREVRACMESAAELSVPLVVDIGSVWSQLQSCRYHWWLILAAAAIGTKHTKHSLTTQKQQKCSIVLVIERERWCELETRCFEPE